MANEDIRSAKSFLRKRGVKGISAREFSAAAKESGQSFAQLLKLLSAKAVEVSNA